MPSRKDGRVEPGQPIKTAFSASAWNRAQDAADIVLRQGVVTAADAVRGPSAPHTTCLSRPTLDVERWGIMEIGGLYAFPTGTTGPATAQFQSMPVLISGVPQESTQAICVAVEPIKNGSIGRVAVDGVVPVKIEVTNTGHRFARCKGGSSAEMVSDYGGPALILWKEDGTGSNKWALVRIGDAQAQGIDVLTNVTLDSGGMHFEKKRVWAIGVTGVNGTTIGVTGC